MVDEGIIVDGRLMSFSNDLVVRHLEKVVVEDSEYEVVIKNGVEVRVPVNTVS